MKKIIIKVFCFLLLFAFLFYAAQEVLHYRWAQDEALYTRCVEFSDFPENSIDVLAFGTSEIYADYAPIVTYHSEGITGYNFAVSYRSAITTYFQLLYALKYQTPKVVVCDFSCLFDDQLPSQIESVYRKVAEGLPDTEIRQLLINTICEVDSDQSYFMWKYPLLRYHSRWSELTEQDFMKDPVYDDTYPAYKKGSMLSRSSYNIKAYDKQISSITPDLWDTERNVTELSEISVYYYDLFIQACQEKDIEVVAMIPPRIIAAEDISAKWDAMKEYFDSRGVEYLNYNTYDEAMRIGLVLQDDYYNAGHLNVNGAIKLSKVFAADLKEIISMEDHREDESYWELWGAPWEAFEEKYIPNPS